MQIIHLTDSQASKQTADTVCGSQGGGWSGKRVVGSGELGKASVKICSRQMAKELKRANDAAQKTVDSQGKMCAENVQRVGERGWERGK